MSLLDRPRCPNCNSEVDLKELWRAAPKTGRGGTVIAGSVGLACPTCGVKLKVLQARLQIASVLLFLLPFGLVALFAYFDPFYKDEVMRRASVIILLVSYASGFFLVRRMSPRLLRLRLLKDGEKVRFPLEVAARIHEQEVSPIQDEEDEAPEIEGPTWVCPKCHEENPGNFDECWKCQTWRTEVSGKAPP
jgi:hypothetical protein